MPTECEQEIGPCPTEEGSSSTARATASKDQMCSVPHTSLGLDDSLNPVTHGMRIRSSLWPNSGGQWPDGGGKNVKNLEF